MDAFLHGSPSFQSFDALSATELISIIFSVWIARFAAPLG